ncbi:hypothetical protein BIT28_21105 [Photobacterium proteolyticum]|uniref:Uncharacterized protein n=1 Tax=Photobacterium proteolyticum TaxID=1903952 RepID=A0A1Q9G669_9GAMM|nr:hypothetical protein [Photobacterium proteolyticum]OLQ69476.1 hypothetical protein BIT28_21105 [Photobacterium proteolyticum]
MFKKKLVGVISALTAMTVLTACGGGDGGTTAGGNTDPNTPNNSGSEIMPYSAERVVQKTYDSLGADIQYVNETNDERCTYSAFVGSCEHYSYKDVAYNIPLSERTSMDDIATVAFTLQGYIEKQAELWGYDSTTDLLSAVSFTFKLFDEEIAELVAYDLDRQDAFMPTVIDSAILADAKNVSFGGKTCSELGYGAYTANHCKAIRYLDSIKAQQLDWQVTAGKILRSVSVKHEENVSYFDGLCSSVTSAQVMCNFQGNTNEFILNQMTSVFGANKSAQIYVTGFNYQGDQVKGKYNQGQDINMPNNLSSFPEFDAKVFNHELTHMMVYTQALELSPLIFDTLETRFMEEGIPVVFAKQELWTWAKMAELAQGGVDSLLTSGDYTTRGSMVNYLLVAKTTAEAQAKHEALVKFIKTIRVHDNVPDAFNNAGFTNHKGEAITIDSFGDNIAVWIQELANDPQVLSYKSLAYNNFK